MGGSLSRNKGARGEREVCNVLRAAGYDVARGDQSAGARCPDVDGVPGIWIEVKIGKRVNVRAAWRQACNDTDSREPVVAWRDDRGEWMVLSRLESWARWVSGL
jgi:Holliday junction resolvase